MKKALIILIIISISIVLMSGCKKERTIEYTKIEKAEDIPQKIMDNIRNIELKRGSWQFAIGDWYDTEYLYFMVCGGSEYLDGYDVDIKRVFYQPSSYSRDVIYDVYYYPYISELKTNTIFNYSEGLTYPIVVFRIDTKFGDEDSMSKVFVGDYDYSDNEMPDVKLEDFLEVEPNYPPE